MRQKCRRISCISRLRRGGWPDIACLSHNRHWQVCRSAGGDGSPRQCLTHQNIWREALTCVCCVFHLAYSLSHFPDISRVKTIPIVWYIGNTLQADLSQKRFHRPSRYKSHFMSSGTEFQSERDRRTKHPNCAGNTK